MGADKFAVAYGVVQQDRFRTQQAPEFARDPAAGRSPLPRVLVRPRLKARVIRACETPSKNWFYKSRSFTRGFMILNVAYAK